jgi:hypothetical protein
VLRWMSGLKRSSETPSCRRPKSCAPSIAAYNRSLCCHGPNI